MELTFFIKGIVIGFAMAVPIGPIGIICIRKTFSEGQLHGMVVGLGAATADFIYGCVAAFGLTMVESFINSQKVAFRLVGGVFLIYLGIKTFKSKPADPTAETKNGGLFKTYISIMFLTLTNPTTIFAFIGIFATLGLGNGLDTFSASALGFGVFTGSLLWFLFLSYCVKLFRTRINADGLQWINRIAGVLILISAGIAFASLI